MSVTNCWQMRARFAKALATMYGREVPAYNTLVEVTEEVNQHVLARDGHDAERLGSVDRVSAERHGAIRVGTEAELRDVARLFAGFGMLPVGFYDLRDASASAVPVVATAFRPIDTNELARNPFRVFTSSLVTDDRRFFDPDLQGELDSFLSSRTLFPPEALDLADRAAAEGFLPSAEADRLIELATATLELSAEPVDRAWYDRLEAISSVAADIGGVRSTHINHLTPRVLDIDELYRRMQSRGITMIDAIQGPPRWEGPDVLLRQTSFRALAEPRRFLDSDGNTYQDSLRVRFGEVEARGIALTPRGRYLYDTTMIRIDHATRQSGSPVDAAAIWREMWPADERGLALADLAFFEFTVAADRPSGTPEALTAAELLKGGWITARPIVYEDFLPRSAAGIFQSNLTADGSKDDSLQGAVRSREWMSGVLGREVLDPNQIYHQQRAQSLAAVARELGVSGIETSQEQLSTPG
ncbi:2-oxoadipate dioxygenase/decarboxylase family protein [Nocardia sp. KC 131]|uniref:2-oxoadipate dioxygenase/decarboxylase n=1 Tax=Nocardia arseniciresistens TaxID=3392119 RepID=UPI00398E974A